MGELTTVLRRPEAPRGPLLVPPSFARWSALAAVGLTILLSAGLAVLLAGDELAFGRGRRDQLLGLTFWLGAGATLGALPVIGQSVAAATGQRGVAAALSAGGLVAILAFVTLRHGGLGWRAEERVAGVAFGAGVIWLAGSVVAITIGRPSRSLAVRRHRRLAAGTLAFAAASVLTLIAVFLGGLDDVDPGPGSIVVMILTMIAGWGTIIGLAMCASTGSVERRHERRRARAAETVPADAVVSHDCPGCGVARELPRGVHRCDRCGTRVRIVIEEPRCRCGYAFFRLPGTRCPECGRDIPDADRYAARRFDETAPDRTDASRAPASAEADQSAADASPPAPAEIDSDTSDEPPPS